MCSHPAAMTACASLLVERLCKHTEKVLLGYLSQEQAILPSSSVVGLLLNSMNFQQQISSTGFYPRFLKS